ncbi:MAG: endonuclease VIII [Proteobacteria bacterium]|nr:endonuclease VIII [Pseudomonadota bacterium]
MPEGPEIRLEADKLAAVLDGEIIIAADCTLPALRRGVASLAGQRVSEVTTRGKAMLIRFDDQRTLYSHNQLYGRWYVMAPGALPRTTRSLRLALHSAKGSALLYSASTIELLAPPELAAHPFLSRLGPDVLSDTLDWRTLAERLDAPAFRRRGVAALYLDQTFLAGIGNYLRSEILFFARVPPSARPLDLDARQRARLARCSLDVTRRAYQARGVTNPHRRVAELKAAGVKRGGYRFAVFAREGQPCYECGTSIERMEAGARRLYWCRQCQGGAEGETGDEAARRPPRRCA